MDHRSGPDRAAVVLAFCLALTVPAACQTAPPSAVPSADSRESITLTGEELAHLRAGMRTYLEATHAITDALARNKLRQAVDKAREAGTQSMQGTSLAVAATLPPAFTLLALDTHQKFDALAQAASGAATRADIQQQLSDILANCTACHATYRVAHR